MIIPKLALKNLLGAGLRTWLNVVVLSFSFVAIIWTQGLYEGMNKQASTAMIDSEFGGGQYWQENYDPYDPLSIQESHSKPPAVLQELIAEGVATPVLIVQGTIYPEGRFMPVLLKGIDPAQKIVDIPAQFLKSESEELPALIGADMASTTDLKIGDYVTIRWRDADGAFDADDARIVQIMNTQVQDIDKGQIWLPLDRLQKMAGMQNEATLIIVEKNFKNPIKVTGWTFKNLDFLLQDIRQLVKSKSAGSSILYVLLLFLAMIAIFDTQVLSIFRRRKEIGTLIALGMTRGKVIQLFTFEGALHGVLAAGVAALYGLPLLVYTAQKGWALPQSTKGYGFSLGSTLFPSYSFALIVGTTLLVMITVTIVSFLPTRKIAKLKPTDALRGKIT
ncbi:MAG: ABC transporter permease [Calditrichaeota bacterium]|nr:ABC transporter permease [Calditrichota bacterium]